MKAYNHYVEEDGIKLGVGSIRPEYIEHHEKLARTYLTDMESKAT